MINEKILNEIKNERIKYSRYEKKLNLGELNDFNKAFYVKYQHLVNKPENLCDNNEDFLKCIFFIAAGSKEGECDFFIERTMNFAKKLGWFEDGEIRLLTTLYNNISNIFNKEASGFSQIKEIHIKNIFNEIALAADKIKEIDDTCFGRMASSYYEDFGMFLNNISSKEGEKFFLKDWTGKGDKVWNVDRDNWENRKRLLALSLSYIIALKYQQLLAWNNENIDRLTFKFFFNSVISIFLENLKKYYQYDLKLSGNIIDFTNLLEYYYADQCLEILYELQSKYNEKVNKKQINQMMQWIYDFLKIYKGMPRDSLTNIIYVKKFAYRLQGLLHGMVIKTCPILDICKNVDEAKYYLKHWDYCVKNDNFICSASNEFCGLDIKQRMWVSKTDVGVNKYRDYKELTLAEFMYFFYLDGFDKSIISRHLRGDHKHIKVELLNHLIDLGIAASWFDEKHNFELDIGLKQLYTRCDKIVITIHKEKREKAKKQCLNILLENKKKRSLKKYDIENLKSFVKGNIDFLFKRTYDKIDINSM